MAESWNVNVAPALPYLMDMIQKWKSNDLYDQLQKKAASGDYSPIEGSVFVDPKETYQANQTLKGLRDAKEAAPYMQGLVDTMQAGFDTDPQYQADAKATLAEYAAKMPGNPVLTGAAKAAQDKLSTGLIIADAATDIQGNGYIKPMTLAQLASQKDGNTTIERLIAMNKQQDEAKRLGGQQTWLRASGGLSADPKLRALAEAVQYGVTPEMFNSTAKTYGLDPVEMKPVDTGTGNGNERQVVAFNPRTGATGQRVGNTWTPESMRVTVSPVIQQETAYSKGKGEYLAKREADILAAGDMADKTMGRLDDLEKALKGSQSGPLAGITTTAGKYTGGVIGANKSQVANAAKADTIAKMNTLESIRLLGPGITNAEREFLMEAQAKKTLTRGEQNKIIELYRKDATYKQQQRDRIVGDTFGSEARQDPARSERGVVGTDSKPSASDYNGKTMTDTKTGRKYKSNGRTWVEVR